MKFLRWLRFLVVEGVSLERRQEMARAIDAELGEIEAHIRRMRQAQR